MATTTAATSKRKAEDQLTKDDYEKREEQDGRFSPVQEGFGIPKASAEQMKGRKIVRARRPLTTNTTTTSSSNPFASVNLTVPSSATVTGDNSTAAAAATTTQPQEKNNNTNETTKNENNNNDNKGKAFVFGSSAAKYQGFATLSDKTATFGSGFSKTADTAATSFAFAKTPTEPAESTTETNEGDTSSVLPKSYLVQSGEEDETVVLELRCRSYRFGTSTTATQNESSRTHAPPLSVPPTSRGFQDKDDKKKRDDSEDKKKQDDSDDKKQDDSDDKKQDDSDKKKWVEVGTGPVRILKKQDYGNDTKQFCRLVQRLQNSTTDNPTKVLVNCLLGKESKVKVLSETQVQVSSFQDQKTALFLFKFKTSAMANEFRSAIEQVTESAKSFLN